MTEVFDTRACELGEGPFWHPERQQLFWFDILGHRLLTRTDEGPQGWDMGEHASAAGWIDRDRLIVATESGLYRFDLETGARDLLAPLEADRPATRSNDGRADPMGGFWIGTMGKSAEPRAGAIYRYYEGRIERLFDGITIPNAICFAPDGRRAYYTDTPRRRIWTVPLDAGGWPDGPPEVFVDLREEGVNPDGAEVDAEGALWNAQWGAGRVVRYLPDGRQDRVIDLPASLTTCPCFGGPGLDRMYVTSAWEGLATRGKADGCTFVTDPGCRGRAAPQVRT